MKLAQDIAHFFVPRDSNNHRARILHRSSLLSIIFVFVAYQLLLQFVPNVTPQVLGYAANISPEEVIRLTNERRLESGLTPLTHNETLSNAAQAKAADMLNNDYWAHVSPDGTEPWLFFLDFGYMGRGAWFAVDLSLPLTAIQGSCCCNMLCIGVALFAVSRYIDRRRG